MANKFDHADEVERLADAILLPCPFCGGEAELHLHSYYGECTKCGAEGPWNDDCAERAIIEWNTRSLSTGGNDGLS